MNKEEFKIVILAEVHPEIQIEQAEDLIKVAKIATDLSNEYRSEIKKTAERTVELANEVGKWLIKVSREYADYHRVMEATPSSRKKHSTELSWLSKKYPSLKEVFKWHVESEPFESDIPRKLVRHSKETMWLRYKLREIFGLLNILKIIKRLKKEKKEKLLIITGIKHAEMYKKILSRFGYESGIVAVPKELLAAIDKNIEREQRAAEILNKSKFTKYKLIMLGGSN